CPLARCCHSPPSCTACGRAGRGCCNDDRRHSHHHDHIPYRHHCHTVRQPRPRFIRRRGVYGNLPHHTPDVLD
ncbi:hypothetical protein, partial [uncultured Bilophila sp.]|uniref:hypothetical protein n=1 Tax=uncultured Bilophila sp. TaxID=529385 RepID=UPI002638D7B1